MIIDYNDVMNTSSQESAVNGQIISNPGNPRSGAGSGGAGASHEQAGLDSCGVHRTHQHTCSRLRGPPRDTGFFRIPVLILDCLVLGGPACGLIES